MPQIVSTFQTALLDSIHSNLEPRIETLHSKVDSTNDFVLYQVIIIIPPCFEHCREEIAAADGRMSVFDDSVYVGTPLDALLTAINNGRDDESCHYHHQVTYVNSSNWLEGSRERVFILLVRQDLGKNVLLKAVPGLMKPCSLCCPSQHQEKAKTQNGNSQSITV